MIPGAATRGGRYLELKPDTASGRRAAARQVRRYQEDGERRVRAVYYKPKDVP